MMRDDGSGRPGLPAAVASAAVACLAAVTGCATGPSPVARPLHQHCQFLAVERVASASEVPAPVDSLALVLRVRPGGHAATEAIVTVRREERHDLESRLRAHPDLLCAPEAEGSNRYLVELPPSQD